MPRSSGRSAARSASVFGSFDTAPLAAASIAQVHTATLKDGREVIIKVLRPGMQTVIRRDLEVLYALAELALRYWPDARAPEAASRSSPNTTRRSSTSSTSCARPPMPRS